MLSSSKRLYVYIYIIFEYFILLSTMVSTFYLDSHLNPLLNFIRNNNSKTTHIDLF